MITLPGNNSVVAFVNVRAADLRRRELSVDSAQLRLAAIVIVQRVGRHAGIPVDIADVLLAHGPVERESRVAPFVAAS